ncbi:MAG: exodeoxyribonuclease III [Acidobacteriota bacterium]
MKIATWNINGINSRLDQVLNWCRTNEPDVLCLQETKTVDSRFPHRKIQVIGYPYVAFLGEKSYNGISIISKYPINDLQLNFPRDKDDAPKRLLAATINGVRIVNVYVPHGTQLGSDKFDFKLDWIKRLRKYFDKSFSLDENVLLCGDLNIAPHEMDVWKPSFWKDRMHFTKPEREAIQDLKKWGFVDVFRQLNEDVREYSWWDYFHHSFEKDQGLRIDHIWTSPPLAELCTDCWIDKEPRGWEHPSDHAPVVADFLIR